MKTLSQDHKQKIAQSVKRDWEKIDSGNYKQRCKKMSQNRKGKASIKKGTKLSQERREKIKLNGFKKGHNPWNKNKKGLMPIPWNKGKIIKKVGRYVQITVNGKRILEHQYVYCLEHGLKIIPKGYEVHHINKNRSDNRIENLILLTKFQHRKEHGYKGY